MPILIATSNQHKVMEIRDILDEFRESLKSLSDFGDLPKPEEDGSTYYKNALKKALHYHWQTGLPTLSDDSGLEIDAFNGEPGIYSARYINPKLSFEERNRIILEKMQDVPDDERSARFYCCSVLVLNENDIRSECGVLEGRIGYEIKGKYGFGYDPIFFLPDRKLHLAELPPNEKNRISHRANAFSKMKVHIATPVSK
jgi:XTP/dITP diphosphohydrolase